MRTLESLVHPSTTHSRTPHVEFKIANTSRRQTSGARFDRRQSLAALRRLWFENGTQTSLRAPKRPRACVFSPRRDTRKGALKKTSPGLLDLREKKSRRDAGLVSVTSWSVSLSAQSISRSVSESAAWRRSSSATLRERRVARARRERARALSKEKKESHARVNTNLHSVVVVFFPS